MLAGMSAFFGVTPPLKTQTQWVLWGRDVQNLPVGVMPPIYNRSYSITAELDVPDGDKDGVILAAFDHLGGFSLFVQDGLLRHTYSFMGVQTFRQVSTVAVPAGPVTVRLDFEADAPVMAPGGEVTLWLDGQPAGSGRLERTVPIMFSGYAGIDVGQDNGEVVDLAYQHLAPFRFPGDIRRVVFDVRPAGGTAEGHLHQATVAAQHARHIES